MIKKILLWVWGIALTLTLAGVLVHLGGGTTSTFGDGTVQNFPTQFSAGINIGRVGAKVNTINDLISGSFVQGQFTLGAVTTATSSFFATSSIANYGNALVVGDTCPTGISTAPTSTAFGIDAQVITVSTTAQTALLGFTYWNGTSTSQTVATGTVRYTCINTAY